MIKSVGIVGYGHFGKFTATLAGRFLPGVAVKVYSRRSLPDQETFYSLPEVAACDVVVLCGAISEYEDQLRGLLPHLAPHTVVVDVATVKQHTEALCRRLLLGRRYLCLHPMFGPESYRQRSGDIAGFRVVVTASTLPPKETEEVKQRLTDFGFVVMEMTSETHDQLLAETLFLTHYLGQSIKRAGFGRTHIDTVSFGSLMDAVEAVQYDDQLFADVYRFNPYCKAVIDRLHAAEAGVWEAVQTPPTA